MAIYVKFKRQRSVKEFLTLFYSNLNNSNLLTSVETYSDADCTILQCGKNKYRSIDDVLELVQTYYSSFTIKNLAKLLHNMIIIKDDKEYKFYSLYCGNINKTTTLFTKGECKHESKGKGTSLYSANEFYELSKT